jgi:nitrate reductase alpha subunit
MTTRDYRNLYNQFISFGPLVRENGLGAHGTRDLIRGGPQATASRYLFC